MADRYISEKALIENIAKIEDLRTLSTKTVGEAISMTPTADVVEVVRCKDCIHGLDVDGRIMCNVNAEEAFGKWFGLRATNDINYCGYGERMTDNDV
ncbi:MAG: hypothetical protein E7264_12165 [Lachnospiraceae bacterium]|nr:hypothetical protein [Lachnospiraceae bacterium]